MSGRIEAWSGDHIEEVMQALEGCTPEPDPKARVSSVWRDVVVRNTMLYQLAASEKGRELCGPGVLQLRSRVLTRHLQQLDTYCQRKGVQHPALR